MENIISVNFLQKANQKNPFSSDILDISYESSNFEIEYNPCNYNIVISKRFECLRKCNNFMLRVLNFFCIYNLLHIEHVEPYDYISLHPKHYLYILNSLDEIEIEIV